MAADPCSDDPPAVIRCEVVPFDCECRPFVPEEFVIQYGDHRPARIRADECEVTVAGGVVTVRLSDRAAARLVAEAQVPPA
jgi:hypothetical protein